jgi:hypothetical protein
MTDTPAEVAEALDWLDREAATYRSKGAAYSAKMADTIRAHIADLERQLAEAREWRFWVCEKIGLSCAAGAEWTTDEVVLHVADIETRACEAAESQLAEAQSALSHRWECQQSLERTVQELRTQLAAQRERDGRDAARYRLLREEGRDLSELLHLVVGINPGGRGTFISALRHTSYLDTAIDAALKDR